MQLIMAGIDYKTAGVETRELFSLSSSGVQECLQHIRNHPGVEGCVLLSTCNRTELYLSCAPGEEPDPVSLLCREAGLSARGYRSCFICRRDRQAVAHLMMVASGLRSQIRGEDQILTQVKNAIDTARKVHSGDAVLETLFRCGISAAKKAKTQAPLSPVESSVARRALEVLEDRCGVLEGRRVLVIGNGEMGRLATSMLVEKGCRVTMTLRSYKRGAAFIPDGCDTVPYDQRYGCIPSCEILISATASPHFTIRADELCRCEKIPRYLVDLAVPRDIDPLAADLPGITCWNVDELGGNVPGREAAEKLKIIKSILDAYQARFYQWERYRSRLPVRGRERT